ncbi:hypothetical protein RhiirA4_479138 [Rhizophagus irregularis]|uniref:Uncharacterized protein n=1 Tax=Rhizophagus irregularis TaxID=588596 RepID=A0A2I1HFY7_9GLOM|nr:hypothetical protein RhiirA4_479138 [Rhizophagus irregularis]
MARYRNNRKSFYVKLEMIYQLRLGLKNREKNVMNKSNYTPPLPFITIFKTGVMSDKETKFDQKFDTESEDLPKSKKIRTRSDTKLNPDSAQGVMGLEITSLLENSKTDESGDSNNGMESNASP